MRRALTTTAVAAALVTAGVLAVGQAVETRRFSNYLSDKISNRIDLAVRWGGALRIDWSLQPTIELRALRVDNPAWAERPHLATVQRLALRVDLTELVAGRLAIERLALDQPRLHLLHTREHGANWASLMPEQEQDQQPLLQPVVRQVAIDSGEASLRVPWRDTHVSAEIHTAVDADADRQVLVDGGGQVLGEPLSLQITADPLRELMSETSTRSAYQLQGQLAWQRHQLGFAGRAQLPAEELNATAFEQAQLAVRGNGPDASALAGLFGYNTVAEPYALQGTLRYRAALWALRDLELRLGEAHLSGRASYDRGHQRPLIAADLELDQIDVDAALPFLVNSDPELNPPAPGEPRSLRSWLSPLRQVDAEVALRVGSLASQEVVLREVRLQATLVNGELNLQPLGFDVGGGRVRIEGALDASAATPAGKLKVAVTSVNLEPALPMVSGPDLGLLDGELTLQLRGGQVVPREVALDYRVAALDTDLTLTSDDTPTPRRPLELMLDGTWRSEPLELRLAGGPLFTFERTEPLPLRLSGSLAGLEIQIEGGLTRPAQALAADLQVELVAPKTARLGSLRGLDLPDLPAAKLVGHVSGEGGSWQVRDFAVTVAESELTGALRWHEGADDNPILWAKLDSPYINPANLRPLFNRDQQSPPADRDQPSPSDEQTTTAAPESASSWRWLHRADAKVAITVDQIATPVAPLNDVKLVLEIDDGVLTASPFGLSVARGDIDGRLRIDGNHQPTQGEASVDITRVYLDPLLRGASESEFTDQIAGALGGQASFDFRGESLDAMLASATGQVQLLMDSGQLDALLVEALGLDAPEVLVTLIGEQPDPVAIQCAYTQWQFEDGTGTSEALVIATSDSNIVGDGKIALPEQRFSLTLEARPKDPSLLSANTPIRIHGTFDEVRYDVISDELVAKGALAAIGAALFPPAALVPFIETGDADGSAGCQQYIADR